MILTTPPPDLSDSADQQEPDDGTESEAGEASKKDKILVILKYIALVLNPFLVALGTVMMRKMKKLNENVVSCYMNACSIPVMIALCYVTGSDLSAWRDFEALEWFCIFALSVTVLMSQTFRFKALQNEQAAKLQPYQFLAPVYQLIADLAIFAASFSLWQIVGMTIVCSVFLVELIYNCVVDYSKKGDKSADGDDQFTRN